MIRQLSNIGILPVIKIENAQDAPMLAKALVQGDLPVAEVTFRTNSAAEAIKMMTETSPNLLVGAGTVLTTAQVDEAVEAGASFIVSPGLNPKVVQYCIDKKMPVFPGVNNPSDIEIVLELGLNTVKFFPAESSGGLKMLKAMAAPYPNMLFIPTGGIDLNNVEQYAAYDRVAACGGSWMVPPEALENKEFDRIATLAKEAVMKVLGFRFLHVGINNDDAAKAQSAAEALATLFNFKIKPGDVSFFAGSEIEMMLTNGRGVKGHIGLGVYNMNRAITYLKRKGIGVIEETAKKDSKGNIKFIYTDLELSGFAIHITII